MTSGVITISKKAISKNNGVVVLPIEEYKKLLENSIPTYYLKGKEAEELDKLVEKGLREYKDGKTINAESLSGALKIYAKKNKRN